MANKFCARRTRRKKKQTALELLSCPRRIRKAQTNLKRPSSIFSPIRSVVNESTAGKLEFRDIEEFRASARLCKIPRFSLTESLSAIRALLQLRGRNLNLRPGFQFMRNSDRRKQSRRLLEWPEICAC